MVFTAIGSCFPARPEIAGKLKSQLLGVRVLQTEIQFLPKLIILLVVQQIGHVAAVAARFELVDQQRPSRLQPVWSVRGKIVEYGAVERDLNHRALCFRGIEGPSQLQIEPYRKHFARPYIQAGHHNRTFPGWQRSCASTRRVKPARGLALVLRSTSEACRSSAIEAPAYPAGAGRKAEGNSEDGRVSRELHVEPPRRLRFGGER